MTTTLKIALQGTFRKFGFQLVRLQPDATKANTSEYEPIHPIATYAPWNSNSEFLSTYRLIKRNTLVDIYRCWELWTLVGQTLAMDGGILEVGVWRGGTGALMAKRALSAGSNDPVYLCDTFEGVVKAGSYDADYQGGEHSDTSKRIVEKLLRTLDITNVRILKGIFPDETAHLIEPGKRFKLCHLDVDVYQSAKDVMSWIWDRMVPGGVVVYDDYGFIHTDGITKYVNEQVSESDRLVLHNLNGHAIVVKTPLC
ncbi:MAG: TylF/MycF/NovP-related O-methyltransferase [Candidatus Sulfotelmatobacter sp.]|jgi:O-methyltransferase